MADVRRVIVIFVVAILFSIFVQVSIDAVYPFPEYDDFCDNDRFEPKPFPLDTQTCPIFEAPQELRDSCEGQIEFRYNATGCATEAYCETCYAAYDTSRENYNLMVFIVSALLGLIAIVVGLYLPQKQNPINEWIGSGFLLGGIITIFVGTVRYFGDAGRYVRPIIILAELVLIIWLAYKKLGQTDKKKSTTKK